jgi:molecular chaperone GrpE
MEDNRTESDITESEAAEPAGAALAADAPVDIDEVQRQRDEYYDRLLRKTAEFDNFRKRTERERQAHADSAAAHLLEELLPLVELIHRQLSEILRKRGVRPIEALGADFDPHFHQAVAHEPSGEHREGEVTEEFRRGYMLGDRLLRPSMVKVAKGEA